MGGQNRKSARNAKIMSLYTRGTRAGLIAKEMGLTRQRVHAIIRAEREREKQLALREHYAHDDD